MSMAVMRRAGTAQVRHGDGRKTLIDADFEHIAGDAVRGVQLVISHEQQRGVVGEPAVDAMEGIQVTLAESLACMDLAVMGCK